MLLLALGASRLTIILFNGMRETGGRLEASQGSLPLPQFLGKVPTIGGHSVGRSGGMPSTRKILKILLFEINSGAATIYYMACNTLPVHVMSEKEFF